MGKLLAEFKAFALRGSLIELAVAVILGLAFNMVVQALADGVLMQIIAAVFGQPEFSDLSINVDDTPIRYGLFLTALVNFALVALVLFFVVRALNRLMRPRGAPEQPPPTRECPYCGTVVPVKATRCSGCTSNLEPAPA
jgi:large conductance mechanosensitive channel